MLNPYNITEGTLKWAEKRSHQMFAGCTETGYAVENIQKAIEALTRGADEMDDQPESDMARSFVKDLESLNKHLKERLREWDVDRREINYGIANLKQLKGV